MNQQFKELVLMDNSELKDIDKPFQKIRYKRDVKLNESKSEEVDKKAKYNDDIICKYCGKKYKRSNSSSHNKTKVHMTYVNMNQKLRDLLLSK